MISKTIFKNAQILWQNDIWSIEKINEEELVITNGLDISYCYISADFKTLVVDRKIYPKYVQKIAIKLAKENIISIYA